MIDYIGPNTKFIGTVDKRSEQSTIKIGGGCFINGHLVLERSKSEINVGDGCSVGNNTIIDCAESIIIENNVMISYDCLIIDNDSHSIYPEYRKEDVQNYLDGHKHDWTSTKKVSIIKKGSLDRCKINHNKRCNNRARIGSRRGKRGYKKCTGQRFSWRQPSTGNKRNTIG